jgi:membrane protease YdiL (CAAX protease family)
MGETPETDPYLEVPPVASPLPKKADILPSLPQRGDRELWLETLVVLCVAVVPTVCNAFMGLVWPTTQHVRSSIEDSLDLIVLSLGPAVLVVYLIGRGGEPAGQFGLVRPLWFRDALGGAGLLALQLVLWQMLALRFGSLFDALDMLVPVVPREYTFPTPHGIVEHFFVLLSCAAIGFSEEMVTRGYLLPRFERLLRSTWKGVVLTAFLFALWHVYQGANGFLHACFLGLLFGTVFCWLRRIWPLAFAHVLLDWCAMTRVFEA